MPDTSNHDRGPIGDFDCCHAAAAAQLADAIGVDHQAEAPAMTALDGHPDQTRTPGHPDRGATPTERDQK